MHDQVASVVAMAKQFRLSLDRSAINTALPTASLALIFDTLVDLGERNNQTARKIESSTSALVASRITGIESR